MDVWNHGYGLLAQASGLPAGSVCRMGKWSSTYWKMARSGGPLLGCEIVVWLGL